MLILSGTEEVSTVIPSMLLEILTKLPLWFVYVPVFVRMCDALFLASTVHSYVHSYSSMGSKSNKCEWVVEECCSYWPSGLVLMHHASTDRHGSDWGGLLVSCCCRWACGWWMWQILKTSAGGESSCLAIMKELTKMIQFGYTTELRHRCMSGWSCHLLCLCLSYICQWAES